MVARDDVLKRLATLPDPEGGDLSGRVRSLVVRDGRVVFALASRGTARGVLERVIAEAEAAVRALPGVADVLAAVVEDDGDAPTVAAPQPGGREGPAIAPDAGPTARPAAAQPDENGIAGRARRLAGRLVGGFPAVPAAAPPPASLPTPAPVGTTGNEAGVDRAAHAGIAARPTRTAPASVPPRTGPAAPTLRQNALKGVARIVAVGSGKGGVGKSTVSVNLGVALAAMGWRVGLVDADIFGPSIPLLLGAEGYRPPPASGLTPLSAHGITAMSIGFLVDPAKPVVWRGPMVTGALMQIVRDTLWGELDLLLIDMPPGTGDIQLSLAQQIPLDGAVVVTTPQDLALIDVRKAIGMFEAVNVPILGIVENMATFVCPSCGTETPIFGDGGGAREAERRGLAFLGRLPLAMAVREASDAGRPVAADAASASGAAFAAIAADLRAVLEQAAPKPFPAIVFEVASG